MLPKDDNSIDISEYKPFSAYEARRMFRMAPVPGFPGVNASIFEIDEKIKKYAKLGATSVSYILNIESSTFSKVIEFYRNQGYNTSLNGSVIVLNWT